MSHEQSPFIPGSKVLWAGNVLCEVASVHFKDGERQYLLWGPSGEVILAQKEDVSVASKSVLKRLECQLGKKEPKE